MQDPNNNTLQLLPPPPSIIGSLRAGFDVIATHIGAISLPVILDLFLWLGPHVKIDQLLVRTYQGWAAMAQAFPTSAADMQTIQNATAPDQLSLLQSINLFAALRTFPLGIASLMWGARPVLSPLGAPYAVQIDSWVQLVPCWIVLTVLGWLGGALYFRWIAGLVATDPVADSLRAVLQSLLYCLIWSLLVTSVGLPVVFLLELMNQLNAFVGQGALLLLALISMWLIVPVFFSPHGIFLRRQNAFASIVGSLQLSRLTLPASSLFVMLVVLIAYGLNLLWAIPASDSWFTLVGILGHGFISTSLLAASFVYYHDVTVWIQLVRERLRAGASSPQT
jgi:hypothetical protein